MNSSTNKSVTWSHRWTFIMAATGSAVGLGNIWKFPYITGEYGGGAFVLVYLACILLIGIPVMMAEVMLGREGRTDPIHGTLKIARESNSSPAWGTIGVLGVLAGMMILMFYSVVAGWALDYVMQSITGNYIGAAPQQISDNFTELASSTQTQMIWHTAFIVLTAGVVIAGVTKGIGNAVEVLMPLLLVLLLILLGYSIAEGDFAAALGFLFKADFSKLSQEAVLTAMGHAFFTLSLGMGSILAYGSYMPSNASIGKTVITVASLDTAIALVAGLAIFPLVFANGLEAGSGPGLLFQSLPLAFSQMTGGLVFGTVFFALVSIAALSSSISLLEPAVAWLERLGIQRRWATLLLALVAWVGGTLCITVGGVFDLLDSLTSKFMLPIGGLLIAIFTGWVMQRINLRSAIGISSDHWYHAWVWVLRIVAPLGVILVFAHSLGMI